MLYVCWSAHVKQHSKKGDYVSKSKSPPSPRGRRCVRPRVTHVLPVSGQMGELHHLVAELAENLDEFLEGADSFQMVQGHQHLAGGETDRINGEPFLHKKPPDPTGLVTQSDAARLDIYPDRRSNLAFPTCTLANSRARSC